MSLDYSSLQLKQLMLSRTSGRLKKGYLDWAGSKPCPVGAWKLPATASKCCGRGGVRARSPATWSACWFCCSGASPRFGQVLRVSGARIPGHESGRQREGAGLGTGATHELGGWRCLHLANCKPRDLARKLGAPGLCSLLSAPGVRGAGCGGTGRQHAACASPSVLLVFVLPSP